MSLRNLFVFLVVLGLVFSAPVGTPISACQDISAPGAYHLDQTISGLDGANFYCIRISTGDVVFDCNGNHIQGDGSGYGVEIKAAGAPNITLKNCNVYGYDYGLIGDPSNSTISRNIFRRNNNYGVQLSGSYNNTIEYNNVSENSINGFYLSGDGNTFTGNRFFLNWGEGLGLNVKGKQNTISYNFAYDNSGTGFAMGGNQNNIDHNTAYGNDWDNYEGGGFAIYDSHYSEIKDNIAYDNTNGFYIECQLPADGPLSAPRPTEFGNTFTDNHAYNNLIGLNVVDYNGTYTDNILEENLEADFLVGGDAWFGGALRGGLRAVTPVNPAVMCDNIFDNMGSGDREIYFTNRTVTLTSGTYSEVVFCDADRSSVSGVTVSGSDSLDNNGMILFFTEGATIKSSNSKDNFMGFGFVQSDDNGLEGCNSDGSGIGIASAVSKDLLVTSHVSKNNRMDSTLLFDLLGVFLGGTLTGEPARAPAERPDIGAGAILLYSPRATFTGVSFSESTIGALFIMSDESTIEGGSAFNNDMFGYGFIDSYNGTTSGAIYGNDGNFYDIFGPSIPGAYEDLALLPLGAGVIDLSTNTLGGLLLGSDLEEAPSTCRSYSACDMNMGFVCDFDSGACVEGTFENRYENARVYENNYGLVLVNKGHEVVEGCRIYDNNVLGIMDASNMDTRLVGKLGTSVSPAESTNAITVTRTSMYRNGEQVFATLSELFERGGMEGWANAFSLLDRSLPKGVLEFELIEGSYIYDMGGLSRGSVLSGVPWSVNHSTVGTGTSSVEFSVQDGAEAVYIISDTTLPSVRAISVQDDDLGIDLTAHLQNEGVANKTAFLNKYFIIAAVGDDGALSAPTGLSMAQFQAHYGSTSGYDAGTMGLYSLNMYRQGWYCEEDDDCPPKDPPMRCYENMCVKPECTVDADCRVHATPQYCVGYQCVSCRNDTDCRGDLTVCRDTADDRRCASAFCIYDSECPAGQYCDITTARCAPDLLGGERPSALLPLSEIANREVAFRASSPVPTEGDVIVKGRWVPVPMQSNNVSDRTITVAPLTQNDRTAFIEGFIGDIIPDGYLLYGDVYGLFATRLPGTGGDDGGKISYVCEQDSDCGGCEFCSIDNNKCLPKEAAQCGVPNKECREGYTCDSCTCVAPECTTDSQCVSKYGENYKCLDYSCTEKPKEEKPPEEEQPNGGEPGEPGTPPVEEVIPEQPEEEKPAYPLVEVEVPSVQAPKQPVSESQLEFQATQIGLVFLLLLGLVAAYLWFRLKSQGGKKGK